MVYLLIYLAAVNTVGFLFMKNDKRRARAHAWRIPERTLFGCALLGGSAGIWAGMYRYRHKTRHWYFVIGIPLILAVQLFVLHFFMAVV